MIRIAATLSSVVQFCTSALCRVPITLITVIAAIIATATPRAAHGDSGISSPRYEANATASVAFVALEITKNIAQPYRKATKPPNASRM